MVKWSTSSEIHLFSKQNVDWCICPHHSPHNPDTTFSNGGMCSPYVCKLRRTCKHLCVCTCTCHRMSRSLESWCLDKWVLIYLNNKNNDKDNNNHITNWINSMMDGWMGCGGEIRDGVVVVCFFLVAEGGGERGTKPWDIVLQSWEFGFWLIFGQVLKVARVENIRRFCQTWKSQKNSFRIIAHRKTDTDSCGQAQRQKSKSTHEKRRKILNESEQEAVGASTNVILFELFLERWIIAVQREDADRHTLQKGMERKKRRE